MDMPKKVDYATKRRLVYVKSLYSHSRQHALNGTEFDSMIALHHLDNAVELLLKCVATHYNVYFKDPLRVSFRSLWDTLVNEKIVLPNQMEISKLHELRSNVQHWGMSPIDPQVVNRFDVYVLDFLRDVTQTVFKVDFDELFMSSLVSDELFRELLTISEKAFAQEDYKKCLLYAGAAFDAAFVQKKQSLSTFVPSLPLFPFEQEKILELRTAIGATLDLVSILMLGINPTEYQKYSRIVIMHPYWDKGKRELSKDGSLSQFIEPEGTEEADEVEKGIYSEENAFFALNFALRYILLWQSQ